VTTRLTDDVLAELDRLMDRTYATLNGREGPDEKRFYALAQDALPSLLAELRASRSAPPATPEAPDAEEPCACGHLRDAHGGPYGEGTCEALGQNGSCECPCTEFAPAPPAQGRGEIEALLAVFEANTRYVVIAKEADLNAAVEREDAARAALLAAFDRALAAQDGQRERVEALAGEVEGADFPWPRETLVEAIRALSTPAAPKKETEHHE
jgi:hypothetical protein